MMMMIIIIKFEPFEDKHMSRSMQILLLVALSALE